MGAPKHYINTIKTTTLVLITKSCTVFHSMNNIKKGYNNTRLYIGFILKNNLGGREMTYTEKLTEH